MKEVRRTCVGNMVKRTNIALFQGEGVGIQISQTVVDGIGQNLVDRQVG